MVQSEASIPVIRRMSVQISGEAVSVLNAHIRSAQGYRDQAIGDLREILRINPRR
jgi:hypothetical protein